MYSIFKSNTAEYKYGLVGGQPIDDHEQDRIREREYFLFFHIKK